MGGREINQGLRIIRLVLWNLRTMDAREMWYSDTDWIKLAMNRVERVLL